jgi:hypothetical protein
MIGSRCLRSRTHSDSVEAAGVRAWVGAVRRYWPAHFHALREQYCEAEEIFVASLTACKDWAVSGGQRGVFFQTQDER